MRRIRVERVVWTFIVAAMAVFTFFGPTPPPTSALPPPIQELAPAMPAAPPSLPSPVDASPLQVSVGLDQTAIRAVGPSERRLVVEVWGQGAGVPGPVAVQLVVDTSGSMYGQGWLDATAAIGEVARSLQPTDMLGVVGFSHSARTILPLTHVSEIRDLADRVAGMYPAGGTDIVGGVEHALRTPVPAGYTGQLLVLSDGQDGSNAALTSEVGQRAQAAGWTTSALGIGTQVSDVVLSRLAVQGGGTWRFASGTDGLVQWLAEEIDGARSAVLRDVQVLIPDASGMRLDRVFVRRASRVNGGWLVPLGAIGHSPRKVVGAVMMYPGELPEITVRARWREPIARTVPLIATTTDDEATLARSTDLRVSALAASAEGQEWLERVATAARTGDIAEARRVAEAGRAQVLAPRDGRDTSALRAFSTRLSAMADTAGSLFGAKLESNFNEISTNLDGAL